MTTWGGFEREGAEGQFAREQEIYLGFCERWRNLPKPTMVEVHGKVIAGGVMLVWPFDIVIASEDATFQDNTVAMGICGAEFFNHPYELGVRKAKEMLFTSDEVSAADALRLGAVNHVVPREELSSFTLAMARRIAAKNLFSLKLTKMAVNAAQDNAGRTGTKSDGIRVAPPAPHPLQADLGHGDRSGVHGELCAQEPVGATLVVARAMACTIRARDGTSPSPCMEVAPRERSDRRCNFHARTAWRGRRRAGA